MDISQDQDINTHTTRSSRSRSLSFSSTPSNSMYNDLVTSTPLPNTATRSYRNGSLFGTDKTEYYNDMTSSSSSSSATATRAKEPLLPPLYPCEHQSHRGYNPLPRILIQI